MELDYIKNPLQLKKKANVYMITSSLYYYYLPTCYCSQFHLYFQLWQASMNPVTISKLAARILKSDLPPKSQQPLTYPHTSKKYYIQGNRVIRKAFVTLYTKVESILIIQHDQLSALFILILCRWIQSSCISNYCPPSWLQRISTSQPKFYKLWYY